MPPSESLFNLGSAASFDLPKVKRASKGATRETVNNNPDSRADFIQNVIPDTPSPCPTPLRQLLKQELPGEEEKEKVAVDQGHRRSSVQDISGHAAREQLMASLVNEKDATQYFLSRQSHLHNVKFLHLLPADPGYRGYRPYDMIVVSEEEAETKPLHYVMSETACTEIRQEVNPHTGAMVRDVEAKSLADWLHERDIFNMIQKRYPLFGRFSEIRALYHWRAGVRSQQIARFRKQLSERLSWKDPNMTPSMLAVRAHSLEIAQTPLLEISMRTEETTTGIKYVAFDLKEFRDIQVVIPCASYHVPSLCFTVTCFFL